MKQYKRTSRHGLKLSFLLLLCLTCWTNAAHATLTQDTDGYYLITSAQDLVDFSSYVATIQSSQSLKARQTADIDMSGVTWKPIGDAYDNTYDGIYDGGYHTISNLTYSSSNTYCGGLVNYLYGTVENVTMVNVNLTGTASSTGCNVGAIAGESTGTIKCCRVNSGTITSTASGTFSIVGGIVGDSFGTVENCYNAAVIANNYSGTEAANYAGGIAGETLAGTVRNCYNAGAVSRTSTNGDIGGIVGYQSYSSSLYYTSYSTVSNCYNMADVTSGGIVGFLNSGCTLSNSYNNSNSTYGIAFFIEGTAKDCLYKPETAGHTKGSGTFTNCARITDFSNICARGYGHICVINHKCLVDNKTVYTYNVKFTINDEAMTTDKNNTTASVTVDGITYSNLSLTVSKNGEGIVNGTFEKETSELAGSKNVTITAAGSSWDKSISFAAGTYSYESTIGYLYTYKMTINDARLTSNISGASITINGNTYTGLTLNVAQNYVGTLSGTFASANALTTTGDYTITAGGYSWSGSLSYASGTYSYESTIGYLYTYKMTINDARLTSNISGASITINGNTYTGLTLNVAENYVSTLSGKFASANALTTTGDYTITAGGYSWSGSLSYASGTYSYEGTIGAKLYPVYLWFYDKGITTDLTGCTLSVTQNGTTLTNSNLYTDGTIYKQGTGGVGRLTAYMPESSATTITAQQSSLNGGSGMTQSGLTVKSGTNIILFDDNSVTQITSMDLSQGDITIEDDGGGKMKFTYGGGTTVTGQSYFNTFEIMQSNSATTTTPHTITIKNLSQTAQLILNGLNINSTTDVDLIDVQNSKVKLLLKGDTKLQRYYTTSYDNECANAIHVSSTSALTIEDYDGDQVVGSLDTGTPNRYGTGIGGKYISSTYTGEATGDITINSGSITATGKGSAAIGNSYFYSATDNGTVTINGGTVNASTTSYAPAIGGRQKSCNIVINGGTVTATGGSFRPAIGGGDTSCGSITINGGTVTATGGYCAAAIGGYGDTSGAYPCPDITITGGTITATAGTSGFGIGRGLNGTGGSLTITGGNIKASSINMPTASNGKVGGYKYVHLTSAMTAEQFGQISDTYTYYNTKNVSAQSDGKYYAALPARYQITWKNGENTLKTDSVADYTLPAYTGATPVNADNSALIFVGWTPAPVIATGDAVYTAKYLTKDANDNYLINDKGDWKGFATAVTTNTSANGKMTADVDLGDDQTMIGSSSVKYTGTFDGQGHQLKVNYNQTARYVAPFRYVNGATIKNLKVTGTIASTTQFIGGIIAESDGATHITNCESNVTINSTYSENAGNGGFVAFLNSGSVTMTDCIFSGSINGTSTTNGGFVGKYYGTLNLNNCLYNGSVNTSSSSIIANGSATLTRTNVYLKQGETYDKCTTIDGTTVSAATAASTLQGTRTDGEAWIYDPTTGYPALKSFATAAQMTKGDDLAATYYNSVAWQKPAGLQVFTISSVASGSATATEYTGSVVPGGTAVIVKGNKGDYTLNFDRTSTASAVLGNMLRGGDLAATTTATDLASPVFYEFAMNSNNEASSLGFYWEAAEGAAFTSAAHKAYLATTSRIGAKSLSISFDDGTTTGIGNIGDDTTGIDADGSWYTLSGQRMNKKPAQSGLYIHNGKKVIIK